MTKRKANTALIIIIIVLAVLLIAAIAIGAYFWGKSRSNATSSLTPTKTATVTLSSASSATPTKTSTTQSEETPKQVVENFMKYTLGTIPGASINYDKARTYLSDTMQAQYSGENWVQEFYKIQDGPTSVQIISENTADDVTTIKINAFWGDTGLAWVFTLAKDGNKWYIDGFSNTAQ